MTKILYVSSAVQAVLMKEIFIPELIGGFWKDHRPVGHGDVWRDVDVQVTTDGKLGPVGFEAPRNYNFLNLEFAVPNEDRLIACAKTVKDNSTIKSVKKELIELGRIVGGRLAARDATPVKLYRGNHREGTVTVSSAKARAANKTLAVAAEQAQAATPKVEKPAKAKTEAKAKKTVTKVKKPKVETVAETTAETKETTEVGLNT